MRKVIGIGETILDIIFRNNRPHTAVPGGSTFNGLISLGRLGVPVSFISEVGNDHVGDIIRDFMKENNISTRYVDRFPDGKSPISLAFLDNDSNADYTFYSEKVYTDHIRFYCDRFITTHGAGGVNLYHGDLRLHFDSPSIRPVSTIGAGDNFNAGILYGLLKNNVRHRDLATLPKETWANIIRCGIDLATEVCRSYDNYISKEFATSYLSQS